MTGNIILKILAIAIMVLWWFLVIEICWDNKLSKAHNLIMGTLVFVVVSFVYMFPAWVFFE